MRRNGGGFSVMIILLMALAGVGWSGTRFIDNVQFNQTIGGHLKRAADANTVELATTELRIAVDNAKAQGLTKGYTSIVYRTPDEDVGFWYQNLTAALTELEAVKPDATQLEKANVLMKLRETLLDNGNKGTTLTVPDGISIYPHNTMYAVVGVVGVVGWLGLMILVA